MKTVDISFSEVKTETDLEQFLQERIPDKEAFEDMTNHEFEVMRSMINQRFEIEGLGILHLHLENHT